MAWDYKAAGLGIYPGKGNDNPLQYSCLGNSMDTVHGVAKSQTRLSNVHFQWLSGKESAWQ